MPVKPSDFLDSAKRELNNSDEICYRNAISRAYYAAYHSCLCLDELLPNHGGVKSNVGMHEQFLSKLTGHPTACDDFAKAFGMKIRSLGYVLTQSKTARCKADYDLDVDVNELEAKEQIERAERIIKKLYEILAAISA